MDGVKHKAPCTVCPVMGFLLRRVMDPAEPPDGHENRTRLGMLAGWTSTALSIALAVVKGWLGLISGSISMLADATNNLTDAGTSLMMAMGFQWSRKPRDEKHPFGHGRIETVSTLVLALALILVGIEVARSGVSRLIHPQSVHAPGWLLIAVAVTVAIKAWMAVFARILARLTRSKALEIDAWNHMFDIVCTLMVFVALISSRMGWGALDAWMAMGVAFYILYTGLVYARDAVDRLLGVRPDPAIVRTIYKTVLGVEGVLGAHDIMVHQYGDVHLVSFHIEVDANMDLVDAHNLTEHVEDIVEDRLGWRAVAHTDPVDRSHPLFEELSRALKQYVASEPRLVDVHDLRAQGECEPYRVSFDLVTDIETPRSDYDEIYEDCRKTLQSVFGGRVDQAEIGIEAVVESAPMSRSLISLS